MGGVKLRDLGPKEAYVDALHMLNLRALLITAGACAGVREGLLDGKWAMITGETFALKRKQSKRLSILGHEAG